MAKSKIQNGDDQLNKLKAFSLQKPLIFSIILIALASLVFIAPAEKLFLPFYDLLYSTLLKELLTKFLVSILAIIVLIRLDLLKSLGLTPLVTRASDWFITWPAAIILLIGLLPLLLGTFKVDFSRPNVVIVFVLMNFFIGLSEELLVRGVILSVVLKKWGSTKNGILYSVLISSLIFGAAHLVNLIGNPGFLVATLSQVVYATLIGIFFAACVLRSRSIWPAIIIHSAIDVVSQLQQIAVGGGMEAADKAAASMTITQAMMPIFIYGMLAAYGYYLLKKVTPATAMVRFDQVKIEGGRIS